MTEIALQDAQALAEAACKNMYDADACTRWLGMRIEAVRLVHKDGGKSGTFTAP